MAKKGLLGLLIGEPKPHEGEGGDEHDDEAEGGDSKARAERAFGRLREALDDGDDKAGAKALHDAIKACEAAEYGDEEEGEGEEQGEGDEGGE